MKSITKYILRPSFLSTLFKRKDNIDHARVKKVIQGTLSSEGILLSSKVHLIITQIEDKTLIVNIYLTRPEALETTIGKITQNLSTVLGQIGKNISGVTINLVKYDPWA